MNTHTNLRARHEHFGLYHLTVALLLGVIIGATLVLSIALTAPANAAGGGQRECATPGEWHDLELGMTHDEVVELLDGNGHEPKHSDSDAQRNYRLCGIAPTKGRLYVWYGKADRLSFAVWLRVTQGHLMPLRWTLGSPGSVTEPTLPASRINFHEDPARPVDRLKVTYVEAVGPNQHGGRNLYVEFNDGATATVSPCQAEGDTRCHWLGHRRGNHRGHSVISLFDGSTVVIRPALLREAGLS